MREFASTKFRLKHAPVWQKRLYSACLGLVLLGAGTNLLFGLTKTGMTPQQVADYYRGNPERMQFEKTPQEMLEVTHAHAFVMPMVLLILGHLFFLTDWSATGKRIVISAAVVAVFLDLLTPWAVRFWHPAWAYLKVAAGYTLGVAMLCLVGVPLMEMWWDV